MKKPAHKKKPSLGKGPGKIGKDSNALRHASAMANPGMFTPQPMAKMKKAKKKA